MKILLLSVVFTAMTFHTTCARDAAPPAPQPVIYASPQVPELTSAQILQDGEYTIVTTVPEKGDGLGNIRSDTWKIVHKDGIANLDREGELIPFRVTVGGAGYFIGVPTGSSLQVYTGIIYSEGSTPEKRIAQLRGKFRGISPTLGSEEGFFRLIKKE